MTPTQKELLGKAKEAVEESLRHAENQVGFKLPRLSIHGLAVEGFLGKDFSLEEIVSLVIGKETFPRIIDIAVKGLGADSTFLLWLPSGHSETDDLTQTWNQGYGPFKPVGVMSGAADCRPSREMLEEQYRAWLSGAL
jgi:hypothetical protein